MALPRASTPILAEGREPLPGAVIPETQRRALSFQSERFIDIMTELPPLFLRHWEEVAVDRDKIVLNPDWDRYCFMDLAKTLAVQTARVDGKLVGYFVSVVVPHLHYKHSLSAVTDIYWLAPEHRAGLAGYHFFRFAEHELRNMGVQRHFVQVKLHVLGRLHLLWRRLGYRPIETWFSKLLR